MDEPVSSDVQDMNSEMLSACIQAKASFLVPDNVFSLAGIENVIEIDNVEVYGHRIYANGYGDLSIQPNWHIQLVNRPLM